MRFNLAEQPSSLKNLSTVLADFEAINAQFQAQKQEASQKFKIAFEDFLKDFFTLVPQVKRIVWTQYTPYFNDGDTCTFSVHEPQFYNYTDDEDDESETWEIGAWEAQELETYGLTKEQSELINTINDIICNNDDFLEDIFGDHQEITATAEGIESDYCEHD